MVDRYRRDVDVSLIRKNLTLSHEERFLQLMALQGFARELRRAARSATGE